MGNGTKAASALLLIAAVTLIPPYSAAKSVSVTATTTLTTSVINFSTFTSTVPVKFDRTPDQYNGIAGFFRMDKAGWVYVTPTGESVVCIFYDFFIFHANASQRMRIHFELRQPINFYILRAFQLPYWQLSVCGRGNWHPLVSYTGTSYQLNWVAPESDEYLLLFFTQYTNGPDLRINFSAQTNTTSTLSSSTPIMTTQAMIMIINETQPVNTSTSQPTTQFSPPNYPLYFGIGIAVVTTGILGVAVYKRARRHVE